MAGTKYDDNKPRMDLLDYRWVEGIAQVLTFGAEKYGTHNWRKGIKTSRLFAALLRHMAAHWSGEDLDKESGLPHLDHAGACLMMMVATRRDMPQLDDRYKKEAKDTREVTIDPNP